MSRRTAILPVLGPEAARGRINIASFILDASTYSFSIAIGCHAEAVFKADYWMLGKLGGLTAFCYSLICLLSGGLSDRLGSLPLAMASVALLSLCFLATTFARTYEHLLIAGAFMGAALALFWPPIQRLLSRLSPGASLWGALGRFNIYWAIGVGFGTLTPVLYASRGFEETLLWGFVITIAVVPILAARMPEPPHPVAGGPGDGVPEEGRSAAGGEVPVPGEAGRTVPEHRARTFLHIAWIANFTAFFAMVGMVRVFPKITSDLGIHIGHMGWILLPLDIGKITAFIILTRGAFWHYSFRWLLAAQGAAGCALVLAGLLETWWLFILLFPIVGALSGLTYFSSIFYSLNLREGEGKKSGLHETILASGVCLGPLLCGLVGERYRAHPGAALVFGGAVVLLGLIAQGWIYLRRVRLPERLARDRQGMERG